MSKLTTFPHKRKTVSREHRSPYNFQQSQDHNSSKLGRRLRAPVTNRLLISSPTAPRKEIPPFLYHPPLVFILQKVGKSGAKNEISKEEKSFDNTKIALLEINSSQFRFSRVICLSLYCSLFLIPFC